MTYTGTGDFWVRSHGADFGFIDFLVTDFGGGYRGVCPVNQERIYDDIGYLDINEASGPWTVEVKPVCSARSMAGNSISGVGDDVILVNQAGSATITHTGENHFSVWSHQSYTEMDLEVNNIGPFNGSVDIDSGTVFMDISADDVSGAWTISFP
jgi:hypothetical protein